ncbi:cold and drought-regulated protein CORA-like [Chenopodium quinoa]|uniref:cold and drought-regulated protein CORA-like n=1 Tax=Chenopodium quinoa TaxID=63459 RepID=UPI000B7835F0|nr:cold and drought-regulated protein CORA-like [Chenopodium quinoa]
MASKTLLVLCIVAVVFAIAYAGEAAREMAVDSNNAAHNKANGIEDAKYGYPGRGGYPGQGGGGYPGHGGGGYPGHGGGGYPGGRDSCRYGCCGRRDYNGICQRCCPHPV